MENAVKALLIAAAVLVVILLITLGVSIYNSGSESSEGASSTINSTSIQAFNEKFTPYLGNSVYGSTAKNLITQIQNHNLATDSSTFTPGEHVQLNFYPKDKTKETTHQWTAQALQSISNNISNFKKYEIYLTPGCSNSTDGAGRYHGRIVCISVKEL